MERGELVPDLLICNVIAERFDSGEADDGFLLDGFPRTIGQAEMLAGALEERGRSLTAVVLIEAPDDEVVRRLSGRRTCRTCNHVWHLDFDPPAAPDCCDLCGGELFQRDDDKESTIRHRLEVYHIQTEPLVDFYGERGILIGIDAIGPVDDVTTRAVEALRRFRD
jgi:adenylate kinase